MKIEQTTNDGILIITPHIQQLHAKDVPSFKEQILALINHSSQSQVIFDMHHLCYMDSSGVGSFLFFFRLLNSQDRELKFACINKPILNIFNLLSINKLIPFFDTIELATNSCKKSIHT